MNIKEPTGWLARWSLAIQQYDFEILHRAGRLHDNADALSRNPYDDLPIAALSTDKSQSTEISELQQRDPQISPIVTYKISGELPQNEKEARTFYLKVINII